MRRALSAPSLLDLVNTPHTPTIRTPPPTPPTNYHDRDFVFESTPAPEDRPPPLTKFLPFSLWDYLLEELHAVDLDGTQELKAERVTNFLSVPIAVEKIILFGFAICLDAFLYTFTILPIRFAIALRARITRKHLPVPLKCDLVKGAILILSSIILLNITNASQMYHSVRGQETIKLYVIFNVLEIADRLCCSFGQDLLDSLLSKATLGRRIDGSQPHMRPMALFMLSVVYILAHTVVLFYQLVTLNVAINSYSNALITLLMSNQFVEIKGAVFKKFEKENLFQMSCADIVERFQLSLLLFIIALRNLIEISGSTFTYLPTSFLPSSLTVLPSLSVIQSILMPALIVLMSETLVDWLKHAFITKFNHIRPQVYGRFTDVLCRDLTGSAAVGTSDRRYQPFVDQSPAVSRRLGFAALPLACLTIRVIVQAIQMVSDTADDASSTPAEPWMMQQFLQKYLWIGPQMQTTIARWIVALLILSIVWLCLVVIKLLLGIHLRLYAIQRINTLESRLPEEQLNARDRSPIGINESEKESANETSNLINVPQYDLPGKLSINTKVSGARATTNSPSTTTLDQLTRFTMVKSRLY